MKSSSRTRGSKVATLFVVSLFAIALAHGMCIPTAQAALNTDPGHGAMTSSIPKSDGACADTDTAHRDLHDLDQKFSSVRYDPPSSLLVTVVPTILSPPSPQSWSPGLMYLDNLVREKGETTLFILRC